jgi:hypothetical protein
MVERGTIARSLAAAGGCVGLWVVLHGAGLSWSAAARGVLGACLLFVPIGDLILPLGRATLGPFERLVLACCVGYPAAAALHYVHALSQVRLPFWPLAAALALAAAARRYRRARSATEDGPASAGPSMALAAALALLVPGLFWILMRDARVFEPTPSGLRYDHSIDYADHLAYYWELLRGFPPAQIPTVAGLPAPSYHVLGFMPGMFFIRELGLDVVEVHHFIAPSLRLLLLMGGLYVAVRLLTGAALLAIAGLVSVFCVMLAIGNGLEGRIVDAASPFSFFMTSESGGSAIVLWTTIAALLLLSDREQGAAARRALLLASALAGLSYGFKAQVFLLMAGGYGCALLLLYVRDRRRELIAALLVTLAAAAAVFLSWRAPLTRGLPHLTPGLFAQLYVVPTLTPERLGFVGEALSRALGLLPAVLAGVLATALGVWKMLALSPFVPLWLAQLARNWRSSGLAETAFALSCLLALPLGYVFSVKAIDGVMSPYEFIQASQGLAFLAAVVNVVALHALLRRATSRSAGWTAALTLAAAFSVVPVVLTGRTLRTPHRDVVLAADEVCALLYLRNTTPLDAVVISARGEGVPPLSRRLNYHPVVAGFAGRRSVLEYFWREVDPSTDRVRAIRRLFATTDAAEAEGILRRFGVTHVLEYAGRPLRFVSPRLALVYGLGTVRVYRFGSGAAGSPPSRVAPAFGLSCDASHS